MNLDDWIPLGTLLTSLIPSAIIFMMAEARVQTRIAVNLLGAILKLALIALMLWGVFNEHQYEFRFPVLLGTSFILRADALAMFFVTLSGVLWFLTTIYAIAYLETSPHRRRFFGFFSLCVSATVGIALAGNLFTFVMFYELLTLATYPLVVHRGTAASLRAGRRYLIYTLGGGAALLVGAAWLHALVPTVDFSVGNSLSGLPGEYDHVLRAIFVFLMVGLGVKAALVPFHGWLPHAMVAPAPVSALLHAVAVVKAGAFGIVRVVYDVYGIERTHALGLTAPLALWAAATIIYGSCRALFQDDLKRRLAFSTISQVSYIALGLGIFSPAATVGGIVHLVHQGLMKITLFFCAGNLAETLGIHKVSEMQGVGRRMPWTMAAFTIGALGMIGVPPFVGFLSKWYLGFGAIETEQYWILAVLATSSALNAAYFLPILYVVWFREPQVAWSTREDLKAEPHRLARRSLRQDSARWTLPPAETAWGLLVPPVITAFLVLATGLLAGVPFSPMQWTALIVEQAYGRAIIETRLADGAASLSYTGWLMLLTLAVPLVTVIALGSRRLRRGALGCAALAALPAVALAFLGEPDTTAELPWLLLHTQLRWDTTGQVFLRFTAILWLLAGIYARGYLADDPRVVRFFGCSLLAMTGNFGLILSHDMVSFYLFFALMSFASYPLVVHRGDEQAHQAGRIYIVLVVIGELALFAGVLLSAVARGGLLFDQGLPELIASPTLHAIIGLLLLGFGIKAGIVPLHVWLPLAHPAAPTPASAVLSGTMIKAGLLGWLRFLPWGEMAFPEWGNLLLILGLVTAFYGVVVGVTQRDAKAALAYSSISQMGLITLGIGGGLLVPDAWPMISVAILVYALQHGLSKGCLFLSVGIAPELAGAAMRCRWLRVGLVVPALVLAGAPLTLGAVSKHGLKYALADVPDTWTFVLSWLLPWASVGTTLLMARFLYLIWPRSTDSQSQPLAGIAATSHTHSPSATWPMTSMMWAWFALLLIVIAAVGILPTELGTDHGLRRLVKSANWSALWPVGLGGMLAWCCWRLSQTSLSPRLPDIPAGDWLIIWLRVQQACIAFLPSRTGERTSPPIARSWLPKVSANYPRVGRALQHGEALRHDQALRHSEALLATWPCVAISLVIVVAACLVMWLPTG